MTLQLDEEKWRLCVFLQICLAFIIDEVKGFYSDNPTDDPISGAQVWKTENYKLALVNLQRRPALSRGIVLHFQLWRTQSNEIESSEQGNSIHKTTSDKHCMRSPTVLSVIYINSAPWLFCS